MPDVGAAAFDTAGGAVGALEGTTVVEDDDKVVVEVGELDEDKEKIVAGFTLSPRGRASTPVGRFCKRIGHTLL